jgi:UDPglucose 6-dehydrogenase
MRDAPSVEIANALMASGAQVRATDPVAMEVASQALPRVEMCNDVYTMAQGCDALMVITEWNEFKQIDWTLIRGLMRQPVIFDGRNIYDPAVMQQMGFTYRAMGRGYNNGKSNGH